MNKKKLVVFTGAGVSKESGIDTYRDKGGLWEKYNPEIYASIEGWEYDPVKVNDFYNTLRDKLKDIKPNSCHERLVDLEKEYDVTIITQNVDDLHEKAGSSNILHLHGELRKIRKYEDESDISKWRDIGYFSLDNAKVDKWRPAMVFFGENVPLLKEASKIVNKADIFLIIGTGLNVYPATSLLVDVKELVPIYYIDPNPSKGGYVDIIKIKKPATEGIEKFIKMINE